MKKIIIGLMILMAMTTVISCSKKDDPSGSAQTAGQEEAIQGETVQKETVQGETVQEETVQEEPDAEEDHEEGTGEEAQMVESEGDIEIIVPDDVEIAGE